MSATLFFLTSSVLLPEFISIFYATEKIIVSAAALVSSLEHIKIEAFVNLLTVPEAYRGSA